MRPLTFLLAIFLLGVSPTASASQAPAGSIQRGGIRFSYDHRGVWGLATARDPWNAYWLPPFPEGEAALDPERESDPRQATRPPSLLLAYREEGEEAWSELSSLPVGWAADEEEGVVAFRRTGPGDPLRVTETFRTDGVVLDWTVDLAATGSAPVTIGDLAVSIPVPGPRGPTPAVIFEQGFLRHQFVSGAGSFVFFTRASGAPPYLLVTPLPGTHLEYFTGGSRGGGSLFVHSARSGAAVTAGTWRQDHTALTLEPAGSPGSTARYGFRFHFAASYREMREILYREGLFDIRVVPGMSLPSDLSARFSLHTRAEIEAVEAEFPGQTTIEYLGEPESDHHLYEVTFRKLGENLVTIRHDGGRETYLEFFSTEPVETLLKKRADFLVEKQQIRDATKWWDGVFGPYDARAGVTRTIEDPDIFLGRMVYVLTCDDPGLSKAPFLASKNVHYPDRREIEALEYYLEHFVWGGLQRMDTEKPYPYGVYGTPEWYTNRSPERRAAYTDRDLDREHVWRSYDYPHVIMLYFHMYEIAKLYPELST
ncbi:MAG: DUF5695 domain-containing protein [Longimicrobiales bacterium]